MLRFALLVLKLCACTQIFCCLDRFPVFNNHTLWFLWNSLVRMNSEVVHLGCVCHSGSDLMLHTRSSCSSVSSVSAAAATFSYSGQLCDWWRRDENILSFTGLYSWNLHIITVHSNSLNVVAPPVHSFVSSSAGLHKNCSTDFHKLGGRMRHGPRKKCHSTVTSPIGLWAAILESSIFYMLSSTILVLWKPEVTIFGGQGVEPWMPAHLNLQPAPSTSCQSHGCPRPPVPAVAFWSIWV